MTPVTAVAGLDPKLWWYIARATGIVAWLLLAASVVFGLALSTRAVRRRVTPSWVLDLHRHLGGLAVMFTAVHLAAIVADNWVHFGVADLLVPFASDWRPGAVAWGVATMYLLLAVELTSLTRRHLPPRVWRRIHVLSFPLFVVATLHLLQAGADAATPALRRTVIAVCGVVVLLVAVRVVPTSRRTPTRVALRPTPANAPTATSEAVPREDSPTDGEPPRVRVPAGLSWPPGGRA